MTGTRGFVTCGPEDKRLVGSGAVESLANRKSLLGQEFQWVIWAVGRIGCQEGPAIPPSVILDWPIQANPLTELPKEERRVNLRLGDFATTGMIEQDRVYGFRIETRIAIDGVSGGRLRNGHRYLLDSAN